MSGKKAKADISKSDAPALPESPTASELEGGDETPPAPISEPEPTPEPEPEPDDEATPTERPEATSGLQRFEKWLWEDFA